MRLLTWLPVLVIAIVFVGARQVHPGGLWGTLRDGFVEAIAPESFDAQREELIAYLLPAGAAAVCIEQYGDLVGLEAAIERYSRRAERAGDELLERIRADGGWTAQEKALVDRQALRRARAFVGSSPESRDDCEELPQRLDRREFDAWAQRG